MIAQSVNLTTAISGILKNTFTKLDPVSALIVSAVAASAMMAGFNQWKNNIKSDVKQYGEGGEVGGLKHSQGGTMIEAEQGEYVIRASQYDKHADLIEAINNDTLGAHWRNLNRDLSVSLDDTNTAQMLKKMYNGQVITIPGGRIEKYGNNSTLGK